MIAINRISRFEARHMEALAEHGYNELTGLRHYGWYMLNMSLKWELVEDDTVLGICGLLYETAFSQPTFWFLLGKNFNPRRHIKACRYFVNLMKNGREGTLVTVEANHSVGHKFAKICGFVPTETKLSWNGKSYQQYKAA